MFSDQDATGKKKKSGWMKVFTQKKCKKETEVKVDSGQIAGLAETFPS